jgi:hypothetical protein
MDTMNIDYNSLSPEQKKEFVKAEIERKRNQFRPQTQGLTDELKKKFLDLACRLSPENLACDGEIPQSEVRKRYAQCMREWKALEKLAGRKVSEMEAFDFYYNR